MAGYIGNKAVGLNVTTGDILGDVGVGGDVTVGDDLTVTDDAAIGGTALVTGVLTTTAATVFNGGFASNASSTVSAGSNGSFGVTGSNNVFLNVIGASANEKHVDFYSGSTKQFEIFLDGNENLIFRKQSGNLQRMKIDSAGAATLANGLTLTDGNLVVAAGHGIDFAAQTATSATNASTTSELLDHYEEGTWTPTLPSGGSVGTINKCVYLRVGSLVTVYGNFNITPTNNSTIFFIGGLPFGASSANHGGGSIAYAGGKDVSNFSGGLVDSSARVYYHVNTASTGVITNSFAGGNEVHFVFQIAYILS